MKKYSIMDLRQTVNLVLLLRTLVIDLHAKNKHKICKGIEKSLENCSICEIY